MRKRLLKKFMAGILSSAMVFGMTRFTQTTARILNIIRRREAVKSGFWKFADLM